MYLETRQVFILFIISVRSIGWVATLRGVKGHTKNAKIESLSTRDTQRNRGSKTRQPPNARKNEASSIRNIQIKCVKATDAGDVPFLERGFGTFAKEMLYLN